MASEIKVDTISEKTSANGVTIDSVSLKDGKVATANSIDSDAYVDGSIDNAHIADDAIDSEHYAAGSIDTAHIADDQITLAKMAGGTDGNIISYDASGDPVAIATGNDGQVLTSTGAGSPPAFEAASGGAWTFISKTTISTDTEIDIEAGIDSTYPLYCFSLNNIKIATDDAYLLGRVKVSSFQTGSDYHSVNTDTRANGSVLDNGTAESTSASSIQFQNANGQGNAAAESFNSLIYLAHPSNTTYYKQVWGDGYGFRADGAMCRHLFFGSYVGGTGAVTGMRFFMHDGSVLTSGTISLFGIKDS